MSADRRLANYRRKRILSNTPEPSGEGSRSGGRRFVVQKHDASSLHYDFRLEIGRALISWAIPKGLSTDPSEKRLAIQTEDHPLDYIDFEGVIPKGQYGGGTVLIWDTGAYQNLRAAKGEDRQGMEQALDEGLLEVWLEGEKLTGGYALKRIEDGDKPQWLAIKMNDERADARRKPTSTEPNSVKTGRSLDEVARDEERSQ